MSPRNAAIVFIFSLATSPVLHARTAVQGGTCVECHARQTPNIVADWKQSHHSQVGVGCDTCHGSAHTSAADAAKAKIPIPDTCEGCHQAQVAQFKKGKHSLA